VQGPGYDSRKLVGSLGAKNRFFDFDKLAEVTRVVTANLNKIIDVNYYPTETARRSNFRHRPIGLGVQVGACGLQDRMRQSLLHSGNCHHVQQQSGVYKRPAGCCSLCKQICHAVCLPFPPPPLPLLHRTLLQTHACYLHSSYPC
jgi:hypothetical protein